MLLLDPVLAHVGAGISLCIECKGRNGFRIAACCVV
jgi:hypothetical protein